MTHPQPAPLLFLAGTLCDARVFAPLQAALGSAAPVIVMGGVDSTPDMAARILADAPARFSLCGFSLGAIVALELVAQAPARVERLALIGGNARAMPQSTASARRAAALIARVEGCSGYIASVWDASVPASRAEDAALRQLLETMASDTSPATFAQQAEISAVRHDLRSRLPDFRLPTIALCGAEDQVCPPHLSEEIAAAIPGARLAIVPDAGHYALLDQTAIVAAALRDWLAIPVPSPRSAHPEFT